jgi:hypothetical protein
MLYIFVSLMVYFMLINLILKRFKCFGLGWKYSVDGLNSKTSELIHLNFIIYIYRIKNKIMDKIYLNKVIYMSWFEFKSVLWFMIINSNVKYLID